MYYDFYRRIIQTCSTNHLAGSEESYQTYTFTGLPVKTQNVHKKGTQTLSETYINDYDHADRLTRTRHQRKVNTTTKPEVILLVNAYDETGRLLSVRRNNKDNLTTKYSYNTRSWVTGITNPLFGQSLGYDFAGNVVRMEWKTGSQVRSYNFSYDPLARLLAANYNGPATEKYSTTYQYDKHGNITYLERWGKRNSTTYGTVDKLTMTYTGNQLLKVTDTGVSVSLPESSDFKDYSNVATEYVYNKNGAMTKDLNKGNLQVSYNSLNLPKELVVKNSKVVGKSYYAYTAAGTKLRTIHKTCSNLSYTPVLGSTSGDSNYDTTVTTDYVGNHIYRNNALKMTRVPGGYVENDAYYFYLTDHLGNNRVVANANGTAVQTNHYYPFGLPMAETGNSEQDKQGYKFGGKEFDRTNTLNLYDFEARMYDGATGRFMTMDPLGEKRPWLTPYHYCSNNPIVKIDPSGLTDYSFNKKTGEVKQVGETNNDPDRIVKTDRKGNVKYNRKGEAKVAIDNIEQGILRDGMNFKDNDNMVAVGGEGQASVEGVESFAVRLSDLVGKEIGGSYFSLKGTSETTHMSIGRYANNSLKETKGHGTNLGSYVSSALVKAIPFMKLAYEKAFNNMSITGMFHTHPTVGFSVSDRTRASERDYKFKKSTLETNPGVKFQILTHPINYGDKFPHIIPY